MASTASRASRSRGAHVDGDPVGHGPEHQLRRLLLDDRLQPLAQHLAVPQPAELLAEPLELVAEPLGAALVEERPEGGEVAAQPAGADPHVVHRLVVVHPHPRVTADDGLHLLGGVAEQAVGRLRAGLGDRRPHVVAEHPVELGPGVGPLQPGAEQAIGERRRAAPRSRPRQLELDLAPLGQVDRPGATGTAGVHHVVGDARQRCDPSRRAGRAPRRVVRSVATGSSGWVPMRARTMSTSSDGTASRIAVERRRELGPLVGGHGQLQVPAGVVAAGAPAQRGAVAGQRAGRACRSRWPRAPRWPAHPPRRCHRPR